MISSKRSAQSVGNDQGRKFVPEAVGEFGCALGAPESWFIVGKARARKPVTTGVEKSFKVNIVKIHFLRAIRFHSSSRPWSCSFPTSLLSTPFLFSRLVLLFPSFLPHSSTRFSRFPSNATRANTIIPGPLVFVSVRGVNTLD